MKNHDKKHVDTSTYKYAESFFFISCHFIPLFVKVIIISFCQNIGSDRRKRHLSAPERERDIYIEDDFNGELP